MRAGVIKMPEIYLEILAPDTVTRLFLEQSWEHVIVDTGELSPTYTVILRYKTQEFRDNPTSSHVVDLYFPGNKGLPLSLLFLKLYK